MSKRIRIDQLLVERGLVESRSLAQRLVMAGQVRANDQVVDQPSSQVREDVELTIDHGPPYVSRGGEKLAAAFRRFQLDVHGLICADVGASTGGFTDFLLQNGAEKVYAIDVGQGILHWKLRNDPRVIVMEGTNARYLTELPDRISFITIDASFISLKILLPVVKNWFPPMAQVPQPSSYTVLTLIKPQYEAGRREAARGKGVVRDPVVHRQVLADVLSFAVETGYQIRGLEGSPILGPKGNVEFLAWFSLPEETPSQLSIEPLIAAVVPMEPDQKSQEDKP
jgi:23S rRNA (cytidine1920-2'-O)/16S rRNA (cytidine1409-2'-O)-methyltransferase